MSKFKTEAEVNKFNKPSLVQEYLDLQDELEASKSGPLTDGQVSNYEYQIAKKKEDARLLDAQRERDHETEKQIRGNEHVQWMAQHDLEFAKYQNAANDEVNEEKKKLGEDVNTQVESYTLQLQKADAGHQTALETKNKEFQVKVDKAEEEADEKIKSAELRSDQANVEEQESKDRIAKAKVIREQEIKELDKKHTREVETMNYDHQIAKERLSTDTITKIAQAGNLTFTDDTELKKITAPWYILSQKSKELTDHNKKIAEAAAEAVRIEKQDEINKMTYENEATNEKSEFKILTLEARVTELKQIIAKLQDQADTNSTTTIKSIEAANPAAQHYHGESTPSKTRGSK